MAIGALKAASRLLSEGLKNTSPPNVSAVYKNVIYKQPKGRPPSTRPRSNKATPTLTTADKIKVGMAFKDAFDAYPSPQYKTFYDIVDHIYRKVRAWKNSGHYAVNLLLAQYLKRIMPAKAMPAFIAHLNNNLSGSKRPSKYANFKTDQQIYAAWLLVQYLNHLARSKPSLRRVLAHRKKIGQALKKTMQRYHKTLGYRAMVPLTCAMKISYYEYQKQRRLLSWYKNWLPKGSVSLKHFVKSLDRTMPRDLRPTSMYPVSEAYRQNYAKWLLVEYIRYKKLKAPPAPLVTLTEKQRKLYLKHAVFPAVWRAGRLMVMKPVEARRYLIWHKYITLEKLPADLYTKLFRYTSKLLQRREFNAERQHIADWEAQYCPSGSQKILNAIYKEAVWTAAAIADAKSAKQRAKPAELKIVTLTPKQKGIILSAILKAVNNYLRRIGKRTRFKSEADLKGYLRKNGWIWSRLTSRLDNILTVALGKLLLGKRLGHLPQQLTKLRRGTPKTLYNSAVFDTNIGCIAIKVDKLPSMTTTTAQPAVALKPLHLSGMALLSARKRLLRAWQANRTLYTNLPNYRDSKKLASYLKIHGSKLRKDEKKFLLLAFRNALNAGYLRSIKPKVKAPSKQDEFTRRVYLAVLKAAEGTASVVARPTPPEPARPRPSDPQLSLQQGLVAAVRKVYGASKSESYAKNILETQTWNTLKALGVVGQIQKEFAGLGYKRASRSSYYARLLVKKTLRNWKSSSHTASTTTHTPVTPARPTPPTPRPTDSQVARQNLLVSAVRATYGVSKSEAYAKTILRTQKWHTLKQLGIAAYIMKGFAKLGYRRASRNHYLALRLVKKTLRSWSASSGTTHVTPARPATRPAQPTNNQLAIQQALVSAVRKVYGASKSESYAKTILSTQRWSTLKQLGIAADIQNAFARLGYSRAARSSYYAQRLLKKTLNNWQ